MSKDLLPDDITNDKIADGLEGLIDVMSDPYLKQFFALAAVRLRQCPPETP